MTTDEYLKIYQEQGPEEADRKLREQFVDTEPSPFVSGILEPVSPSPEPARKPSAGVDLSAPTFPFREPEVPQTAQERPGYLSQLLNDVDRGTDLLQAMGGGAVAAAGDLLGEPGITQSGIDIWNSNMEEVKQNPALIGSFTNIKSVDDGFRYLIEAFGENALMMVPGIVSGGATGIVANRVLRAGAEKAIEGLMLRGLSKEAATKAVTAGVARKVAAAQAVGAYPTSAALETGGIAGEMYEQTGEVDGALALKGGSVSGALDTIPTLAALRMAAGKPAAEQVYKSFRRVLGENVTKEFFTEAPTELLQEVINAATVAEKTGEDIFTEEKIVGYLDAFLKGGLGSVPISAAATTIGRMRGNTQNADDAFRETGTRTPPVVPPATPTGAPDPTLDDALAALSGTEQEQQQSAQEQYEEREGKTIALQPSATANTFEEMDDTTLDAIEAEANRRIEGTIDPAEIKQSEVMLAAVQAEKQRRAGASQPTEKSTQVSDITKPPQDGQTAKSAGSYPVDAGSTPAPATPVADTDEVSNDTETTVAAQRQATEGEVPEKATDAVEVDPAVFEGLESETSPEAEMDSKFTELESLFKNAYGSGTALASLQKVFDKALQEESITTKQHTYLSDRLSERLKKSGEKSPTKPLEVETQPAPPAAPNPVAGVVGDTTPSIAETSDTDLTPEQNAALAEAQAQYDNEVQFHKRQKERGVIDQQMLGKNLKAAGMRFAAEKRKITGQLTDKEAAAKEKREAGNYIGKLVEVDGKPGKVVGNPFGRVRVTLDDDGSTITTTPDKVMPRSTAPVVQPEPPAAETPAAPKPFGQRLLDAINEKLDNDETVYLSTATQATPVTKKARESWNKSGRPLFKVGKDGNLYMGSGKRYNVLTSAGRSLVGVSANGKPLSLDPDPVTVEDTDTVSATEDTQVDPKQLKDVEGRPPNESGVYQPTEVIEFAQQSKKKWENRPSAEVQLTAVPGRGWTFGYSVSDADLNMGGAAAPSVNGKFFEDRGNAVRAALDTIEQMAKRGAEPSESKASQAAGNRILKWVAEQRSKLPAAPVTPAEPPVEQENQVEQEPEVTIKRSKDFSMTGDYDVTIGDQNYRIFRDPETKYWYDSDRPGPGVEGLLSVQNREEAIEVLKERYRKTKSAGPSIQKRITTQAGPRQPVSEPEVLVGDEAKNAVHQVALSRSSKHYTLWVSPGPVTGGRRGWNYMTILGQDLEQAKKKAREIIGKYMAGEDVGMAFVGRNKWDPKPGETVGLINDVLSPEDMGVIARSGATPFGKQKVGMGKYADVLIEDLPERDFDYAMSIADWANRGRMLDISNYLRKTNPRMVEEVTKRGAEDERIAAYEKRQAERKLPKQTADIANTTTDNKVTNRKVEKKRVRKASDQIVDIMPPNKVENKIPAKLSKHMFQIQVDGANSTVASLDQNGAALNGDGAGVGKTRQILAVANHYAGQGVPVVIITENAAIGKPWEGRKNSPVLGGSMAKDSKAMGVNLSLLENDETPAPGQIKISTYNRIQQNQITPDTVVIFDESQNLANTFGDISKPKGEWKDKFNPIFSKARRIAFYSATPADKPHQLAYLYRVLGFGSPQEYLNEALNNGMIKRTRRFGGKETHYYDVPGSEVAKRKLYGWVNGLIQQAGKEGRAIKREISYEGTDVQFHDTVGTNVTKNPWAEKFLDVLAQLQGYMADDWVLPAFESHILYSAELAKIGDAVNMVKRELAAGRKAVLFFSRIRPHTVRGRRMVVKEDGSTGLGDPVDLTQIESPVALIRDELGKAGITFAELHGESGDTSKTAQEKFAKDVDVLLASVESGGTGINLDDPTGKNPRTEIFMFAPYRGISTIQAMGRIWRSSTVQDDDKPNRYIFVVASDIKQDAVRSAVLAKKLQLMNASLGGTAVSRLPMSKVGYSPDQLAGLELPDDGEASPLEQGNFAPGPLLPVQVNWKKSSKGSYYANASADLLEWVERGGPEKTGLNVRVFKGDGGRWVALADEPYPADRFEFIEQSKTTDPVPVEAPAPVVPDPATVQAAVLSNSKKRGRPKKQRTEAPATQDEEADEAARQGFYKRNPKTKTFELTDAGKNLPEAEKKRIEAVVKRENDRYRGDRNAAAERGRAIRTLANGNRRGNAATLIGSNEGIAEVISKTTAALKRYVANQKYQVSPDIVEETALVAVTRTLQSQAAIELAQTPQDGSTPIEVFAALAINNAKADLNTYFKQTLRRGEVPLEGTGTTQPDGVAPETLVKVRSRTPQELIDLDEKFAEVRKNVAGERLNKLAALASEKLTALTQAEDAKARMLWWLDPRREGDAPTVSNPADLEAAVRAIMDARIELEGAAAVIGTPGRDGDETGLDAEDDNYLVSQEAYNNALEALRRNLGKLGMGVDPTVIKEAIVIGSYFAERGIRKFKPWAERMISTLGDSVRGLLKKIYAHVKNVLRGTKTGFDATPAVSAATVPDLVASDREISEMVMQAAAETDAAIAEQMDTASPGTVLMSLDMDKERIFKLLGQRMYNGELGSIVIKEVSQNSFDAIKDAEELGIIPRGGGVITYGFYEEDPDSVVMEFSDNGVGMTPEILQGALFTVGGTHKRSEKASGGFGLAKMAMFMDADRIYVETVSNGIVSVADISREQLMQSKFPVSVSQDDVRKSGTLIRLTFPKKFQTSDGQEKNFNRPYWSPGSSISHDLLVLTSKYGNSYGFKDAVQTWFRGPKGDKIEDVPKLVDSSEINQLASLDAVVEGFKIQKPKAQILDKQFGVGGVKVRMVGLRLGAKTAQGTRLSALGIETPSRPGKTSTAYRAENSTYRVFSNGLRQFQSERLVLDPKGNPWSDENLLPWHILIDIDAGGIDASSVEYPFTNNREGLREGAISKYLEKFVGDIRQKEMLASFDSEFKPLRSLDGGEPDKAAAVLYNNTTHDPTPEEAAFLKAFSKEVFAQGDEFIRVLRAAADDYLTEENWTDVRQKGDVPGNSGSKDYFYGAGLSKNWAGVNTSREPTVVLVNPVYHPKTKVWLSRNQKALANWWTHILMHELNHAGQRNEGAGFTFALSETDAILRTVEDGSRKSPYQKAADRMYALIQKHSAAIDSLHGALVNSEVKDNDNEITSGTGYIRLPEALPDAGPDELAGSGSGTGVVAANENEGRPGSAADIPEAEQIGGRGDGPEERADAGTGPGVSLGEALARPRPRRLNARAAQKKTGGAVLPQNVISQVSDRDDASRVGTAKLGTDAVPVDTPQTSNISGDIVPEDLLAEQMARVDYAHLPKNILSEKDPKKKRRKLIDWFKKNLLALHDAFPQEFRARATHWYDGANRIAKEMGRQFKASVEQASGVIAVFSPQKDWFMNVAQAEQFMELWTNSQDVVLGESLVRAEIEGIIEAATAPAKQKRKKTPGETKRQADNRRKYNKALDDKAKADRRKKIEQVVGKTIRQLDADPELQGWAIRVLAQVTFGRNYRNISPEGDRLGLATNDDGTLSKNGWGSINEIEKAVRIMKDGSLKNISDNLGNEHKVRNFYNNIVAPNTPYGDATIDTHAVAAAHLMPYGAKATEVGHNFGSGMSNSKVIGVSGIYHLYLDAYREAAAERGLQPRQMQSITWEAIRLVYPAANKNAATLAKSENTWKNLNDDNARRTLVGGRIPSPVWAGTNNNREPQGDPAELGENTGPESVAGGSLLSGVRPAGAGRGRRVSLNARPRKEHARGLVPSSDELAEQFTAMVREAYPGILIEERAEDPEPVGVNPDTGVLYINPKEFSRLVPRNATPETISRIFAAVLTHEALHTGTINALKADPKYQGMFDEVEAWLMEKGRYKRVLRDYFWDRGLSEEDIQTYIEENGTEPIVFEYLRQQAELATKGVTSDTVQFFASRPPKGLLDMLVKFIQIQIEKLQGWIERTMNPDIAEITQALIAHTEKLRQPIAQDVAEHKASVAEAREHSRKKLLAARATEERFTRSFESSRPSFQQASRTALENTVYTGEFKKELLAEAKELLSSAMSNAGDAASAYRQVIALKPQEGMDDNLSLAVQTLAAKWFDQTAVELKKSGTSDALIEAEYYEQKASELRKDVAVRFLSPSGQKLAIASMLFADLKGRDFQAMYKDPIVGEQGRVLGGSDAAKEVEKETEAAVDTAATSTVDKATQVITALQKKTEKAVKATGIDTQGVEAIKKLSDLDKEAAPQKKAIDPNRVVKNVADKLADVVEKAGMTDEQKQTLKKLPFFETALRGTIFRMVRDQFSGLLDQQNISKQDSEELKEIKRRRAVASLVSEVQEMSIAQRAFDEAKASILDKVYSGEMELNDEQLQTLEGLEYDDTRLPTAAKVVRASLNMKEMVRQSLKAQRTNVLRLAKEIAETAGLSNEQAMTVALALGAEYKKAAKAEIGKAIERLQKSNDPEVRKAVNSKATHDRLFEVANLGALRREAVWNAIAPRFGLPSFDPEFARKLEAEAERIQGLPENSQQRNLATRLLMTEIANKQITEAKGFQKILRYVDTFIALWKAGILSGPPTQIANFGFSHINMLLEASAKASALARMGKIKNKKAAKSYLGYLSQLLMGSYGQLGRARNEAGNALAYGYSRFQNEKIESLGLLEGIKFDKNNPWKLSNLLAPAKYVGRFMQAADALNSSMASEMTQRAAVEAFIIDNNLSKEEASKLRANVFNNSAEIREAATKQADEEFARGDFGADGPKSRRLRDSRIEEIIEREREKHVEGLIAKGRSAGERIAYNNPADRLIGFVMRGLFAPLNRTVRVTQPLMPFPNTIANLLNTTIDYTPYGYLRARNISLSDLFAKSGKLSDEFAPKEIKKGSMEYEEAVAKAYMGTIGMAAMIALTAIGLMSREEGEEPEFEITAEGPSDLTAREQLRTTGWMPYTVKIGKLRLRYTDWPALNLVMGALGTITDDIVYNKNRDENLITRGMMLAISVFSTTLDRNMLSGMSDFFDIVNNPNTKGTNTLMRLSFGIVGGVTNPNLLRWVRNTVAVDETGMVPRLEQRTFAGKLATLAPGAAGYGEASLNVFAEPIRSLPIEATTNRFFSVADKTHPVITPLANSGLFLADPSYQVVFSVPEGGRRVDYKLSPSEQRDFTKIRGPILRKKLTPSVVSRLTALASRDYDAAREELQDIAQQATRDAKKVYAKRKGW